jgi:hypothetical protein
MVLRNNIYFEGCAFGFLQEDQAHEGQMKSLNSRPVKNMMKIDTRTFKGGGDFVPS